MYFTSGSDRAFESLMQGKPGFDHYDSGDAGAPEDCGDCRFYRPDWKYQFCVYAECPYQPGKLTALDAVKFQVKGVDDEMAVFRVEKNRGYTVMSNHHLRNKDLSLKAKGLLSQMLSLPEDWDYPQHTTPRKSALPHKRESASFFHKFSRRPGVQWASNFFSSKMASCFREVASTSSFFRICTHRSICAWEAPAILASSPWERGITGSLGCTLVRYR